MISELERRREEFQVGELGHSRPWEKSMAGKQLRPHLCPLGIAPLRDGHGWGLEGGQGDVVG